MFEGLAETVVDGDFEPLDKGYWKSGWKHTDEAKAKMSATKKGTYVPWNKGLKGAQTHSEETKEKCRIAGMKGKTNPYRSEESNKKRSEALKKYWANKKA